MSRDTVTQDRDGQHLRLRRDCNLLFPKTSLPRRHFTSAKWFDLERRYLVW